MHGAAGAEVLYELASACSTLGHVDAALDALRRAADAGWADAAFLGHDPAFAPLRDSPAVRQITVAAAERVELPPPIGSGGTS